LRKKAKRGGIEMQMAELASLNPIFGWAIASHP
jgi:hypothetical protein